MKVVNTSGKRKTAIARATITKGKGRCRVNCKPVEIIESSYQRDKILEPIILAGPLAKKVDISVDAKGGGVTSQTEAIRTAIARGFVEYFNDEKLEKLYRHYDRSLLVNDPRRKLPKTPMGRGARKKRQKSYR